MIASKNKWLEQQWLAKKQHEDELEQKEIEEMMKYKSKAKFDEAK